MDPCKCHIEITLAITILMLKYLTLHCSKTNFQILDVAVLAQHSNYTVHTF